jgi:hypothetical protein
MKNLSINPSRSTAWGFGVLASLAALLVWGQPAVGGEKQDIQFTAYVLGAEVGSQSITPSGNTGIEYTSVLNMVVSENPLLNGRLIWQGAINTNAKQVSTGSGTGVFEVGTWDLSGPTPVFTPSKDGGVYVTKWEFRNSAAGPYHLKVVGHGVAGEVEGLQFVAEAQGYNIYVDVCIGQLLDPKAEK